MITTYSIQGKYFYHSRSNSLLTQETFLNKPIDQIPDSSLEIFALHDGIREILLSDGAQAELIGQLLQTTSTRQVFHSLVNKGIVSIENVCIDNSTRISKAGRINQDEGYISIGGLPLSETLKDQMIMLDHLFDTKKVQLWKLSHEIAHYLTYAVINNPERYGEQSYQFFDQCIKGLRQETGKGLSVLGSMEFYKARGGFEEQAEEDITELVNMYMLDPEYLKSVLNMLTEQSDEFYETYQLLRLKGDEAQYIFDEVKNIHDTYLGINTQ